MVNPRPTVPQHCAEAKCCVYGSQKPDILQQGWAFRVDTWNKDSLSGRAGEVVKLLDDRKVDVACVQMRLMGSGCRLFWCCGQKVWQEKTEGGGIFVAEKWVDQVIQIDRYSERIRVDKLVVRTRIISVFSAYAPDSGKCDEEKESFSLVTITGLIIPR